MAIQKVIQNDFSGGRSQFEKSWNTGSALELKRLNVREDPNYITLNPAPVKVSGTTVVDLVKWIQDGSPWTTDRYFYGDSGKLYKETSTGVWSVIRTVSGSTGQGLYVFDNALYYATAMTIGRYGLLDSTPAFDDDYFSTNSLNIDNSQTLSGQTFTLATSISEAATSLFSFTAHNDPIKEISILVAAKGTGNWTLTVHDIFNNVVGSATIANASVNNSAYNKFTFSTPLRIVLGNIYHVHVTSTVADGTVTTGTASNLSTVSYKEYFSILISDSEFHQMIDIGTGLIIANDHYLALWDEVTYDANRLVLPPGYSVSSLGRDGEYVVAAVYKGQDIDKAEECRLYYWDGSSDVFNFYKPSNQGPAMTLANNNNKLMGIYGNRSGLFIGSDPFQSIQDITSLGRGKKIRVYPGASTIYDTVAYFGIGYSTDDTSAIQGVYSYGNTNDRLPEVTSCDFTPSHGVENGTTISIGCLQSYGTDMYISWKNDTTYGVDKLSYGANPHTSGSFYTLIFDNGNPTKLKTANKVVVEFDPLVSGESITPKYKLDRGSEVLGTTENTVGAVRVEQVINKPFYELQFGFNVATGITYPKIKLVYLEFNDNENARSDK